MDEPDTRSRLDASVAQYDAMRNPQTDFGLEEGALKQMDDNVGVLLDWLKDNGLDQDTIVVFTTDNGAEVYTWPVGGTTPFAGAKGEVSEGSFRVPAFIRWPDHVKPGSASNGILSGLDWFPRLVAAAGNPNITGELLKGKQMGDATYKVHLDGYDQTDLIMGKGHSPARQRDQVEPGTDYRRSANGEGHGKEVRQHGAAQPQEGSGPSRRGRA